MGQHEIRYVVEGRPTSWKRTEGNGKGRYTPPEMRKAKAEHAFAALAARQEWSLSNGVSWDLEGAFALEVHAYMPHKGGLPDWDNVGKLVSDAIQGVLIVNDVRIERGLVERHYDKARPRTEVTLKRIELDE